MGNHKTEQTDLTNFQDSMLHTDTTLTCTNMAEKRGLYAIKTHYDAIKLQMWRSHTSSGLS